MVAKARKISPALEERLKSVARNELLEVVLRLEPPQIPQEGTGAERLDATKSKFDRIMTDLAARVSSAGGKVLDGARINSTARGFWRRPIKSKSLASDSHVQAIDAPVTLQPD